MRLIDAISQKYSLSKNKSKKIIDSRSVFVNHKRVWIASYEVNSSDVLEIGNVPNFIFQPKKIKIFYEDEQYFIVDKPFGILTVGKKSLEQQMQKQYGHSVKAVHRLDKDTSGLVIVAKNQKVFDLSVLLFKKHQIEKFYYAIVQGLFPYSIKKVQVDIDGKSAISIFRRLSFNSIVSLIDVEILTGRTHQIRKHLKSLGFYLVGEKQYQIQSIRNDEFKKANHHFLHARKIKFKNPITSQLISIQTDMPDDFKSLLDTLKVQY